MNIKSILLAVCSTLVLAACDSDTLTIGGSLTSEEDHISIATDTFNLQTRSILADAVMARTSVSYLGTVKDPETGEYITANFMTQFHTLEDFEFPEENLIISRNDDGEIIADECELRLFYEDFYGDSLAVMKVNVSELDRPMKESDTNYSNFDPKAEGFLRDGGLQVSHAYTLTDMNVSESVRNSDDYTPNILIKLEKPYTDKNGKTYNNYGSYVINEYYKDPTNFKNSVRLTNNVIPGFYLESTGGLGNMAYISICQLNVRFRYTLEEEPDTSIVGLSSFAGTQEVLQYTRYMNDNDCLKELVNDGSCTYLKTPSGIFTEITFPIEQMLYGHDNDTINSAKFSLQCLNNKNEDGYSFSPASTVLLIPADSISSFFENKDNINYKTSFVATYDESKHQYIFNNVSSLLKQMDNARHSGNVSENWNKAVLIPVTISYGQDGSVFKVSHNMALTSTRIVGGPESPHDAIRISLVYSKQE